MLPNCQAIHISPNHHQIITKSSLSPLTFMPGCLTPRHPNLSNQGQSIKSGIPTFASCSLMIMILFWWYFWWFQWNLPYLRIRRSSPSDRGGSPGCSTVTSSETHQHRHQHCPQHRHQHLNFFNNIICSMKTIIVTFTSSKILSASARSAFRIP